MTSVQRKPSYGSHGTLDGPRPLGDFYRSPPHAMGLLLGACAPERLTKGLILDAGAGDGRLTRPLLEAGYQVRGIDLYDRGHDAALPIETGVDFLALTAVDASNPAAIVMNPPYKQSDAFIRHGLDLLPEFGELHALLRHSWMSGISRKDLLPSLVRVVMCRRLKMLPADREHCDKGFGGAVDFSWFSFRKGYSGGHPKLMFAAPQR
jgi:hypothetical protein